MRARKLTHIDAGTVTPFQLPALRYSALIDLASKRPEYPIYPVFELSKLIEFAKQSFFQIFEIKRQRSLTNAIPLTNDLISLPPPNAMSLQFQKFLNKQGLRRAVLFGVQANWERLLFDLGRLNAGLKMDAALVIVVPMRFIEL